MSSVITIIIISLLFSFLFSGMETAFVSSNKVRIDLDAQEGGLIGRILTFFSAHHKQFVATLLVGNNIALVTFGISMAHLCEPMLANIYDAPAFIITGQTLIAGVAVLIISEFLPGILFRIDPNFCLRLFAIPMYPIYILLYPIARFSTGISDNILRLSGTKVDDDRPGNSVSIDELDQLIQQSIDESEDKENIEPEVKILQNALDFSSRTTRECMIPRPEIMAANIDEISEEALIKQFTDTGFSKIPVYRGSLDHIVGYVHSSDLFKRPFDSRQVVRPIVHVPETMLARQLMKLLMQQKKSIAVVVNEYGDTAGIITLEDLVEEIFGDFEDEHDSPRLSSRKIDDCTYEFSGRMEISKINEVYNLDLPESDDYLTIAGYILHHSRITPRRGDTIEIDNHTFKIIDCNSARIARVVMLTRKTTASQASGETKDEENQ